MRPVTHYIQDKTTSKFYWAEMEGTPLEWADRDNMQLYPVEDAYRIVLAKYGKDWATHVRVIEASATEWFAYNGRKGGRARTPAKTRACRLNGMLGGRKKNPDLMRNIIASEVAKVLTPDKQ